MLVGLAHTIVTTRLADVEYVPPLTRLHSFMVIRSKSRQSKSLKANLAGQAE